MSGDLFAFRDHGMDKFVVYSLSDSAAILQKEWKINSTDGRFHWEINAMKEGKFLTKRNNSKYACRELWDLERGVCLDTLPNTFNLLGKLGKNYYTEFDDYWLTASVRFLLVPIIL